MKAIIFGANGQDGYYLASLLKAHDYEVVKVSRMGSDADLDILNYTSLCNYLEKYKPVFIFNLAANSTTRHDALFENHATISTGTLNILEAVNNYSPDTKVFISGSGLQFVNNNEPIKETDDFEARDAYSVSRIHSVYAARYYRRVGIKTYVGYFFNHDSPQRSERHMAKKISAFAKRIGEGSTEILEIGDIRVIKEWTYAGDVVNGIFTLVQQNEITEANIGSGLGYSIENWLDVCFKQIGKNWKDFVVLKNDFNPEYKMLVSDSSIMFSLGWKPEITFEELAKMMMNS